MSMTQIRTYFTTVATMRFKLFLWTQIGKSNLLRDLLWLWDKADQSLGEDIPYWRVGLEMMCASVFRKQALYVLWFSFLETPGGISFQIIIMGLVTWLCEGRHSWLNLMAQVLHSREKRTGSPKLCSDLRMNTVAYGFLPSTKWINK